MADIQVKVLYSISEVLKFKIAQIKFQKIRVKVIPWLCSAHTHYEAMVQLACTIIGLITLDLLHLNECAAVRALQCCLATCPPDTTTS